MQTYCNIRNCDLCREKVSLKVLLYYKTKEGERKCSENELYCMAHAMEISAKDFENLTLGYASYTEMKKDEIDNKEPDDKEVYDKVGECADKEII